MSITTQCPHCQFVFNLRAALEGRQVRCSHCRNEFKISAISQQTATAPPSEPQTKSVASESPKPTEKPDAMAELAKKVVAASLAPRPTETAPTKVPAKAPTPTTSPTKAPTATKPFKKRPNPLVAADGMGRLCPTLQAKEEYAQYRAAILKPLQTPLPVTKMSSGYKLGLVMLAFFLILLPLVYLTAIIGLCVLEYLYFVQTPLPFQESLDATPGGRDGIWMIVAYFTVPIALGAVIVVMLKPLIFGWGGKDNRFEITRDREPLLFEFVDHLCRFVGASPPKRIFVDSNVNAYAAMSRGVWGALFGGKECDLMIGLPLVAGMTTSEFSGVLAHEFGHFTQSGTMRIDFIVQRLLHWFAHIYYYRDSMDVWINGCVRSGVSFLMAPAVIIMIVVWLARRVIWVLMTLGNLAAGFMSRQMEYDADSYETRLIGSDRFTQSFRKMIQLSIANQKTTSDLNYMLQENRLADNYPLLIAVNMRILNDDLQTLTSKLIQEGKTGWRDTHPCERDRIAAAEKWNAPGVLHLDEPASLLFRNFMGLSREVSIHFYKEEVGLDLDQKVLKNAGAVIQQFQREDLGQKAITNFFQRAYNAGRFLPFQDWDRSKDLRSMAFRLRQVRDQQAGCLNDCWTAAREYDKAETRSIQTACFKELVRLGIKPNFAEVEYPVPFKNLSQANLAQSKFEGELAVLSARFSVRDAAAAERIYRAWELLEQPEVQNRIEDGPTLSARLDSLLPLLRKIGENQTDVDELKRRFAGTADWLGRLQGLSQSKVESLWRSIGEENAYCGRMLQKFQMVFSDVPYPFEHGVGSTTMGSFLVPSFSAVEKEPLEYFQATSDLLGRLQTTYHLALGEALAIVMGVEDAVELPPLPVPPPDENR